MFESTFGFPQPVRELKPLWRCMLTTNLDVEQRFANGTQETLVFNDQYLKAPEDTFHLRERGRSPGTTTVLVPFRRRASQAPKSPAGFSPRFVMSLLQRKFDGQGGASCRCGSCGRNGAHSYFEHRARSACRLGVVGLGSES